MANELKKIREVILNIAKKYNIEVDKVVLFGSRARGGYREYSDWDVLIVTKEKLDWKKRVEFLSELYYTFGREKIDVEIIVKSLEEFEDRSKYIGYLEYWVKSEGILIK